MTTVTVNKQKFELETVIASAIEKAGNGYVCQPDQRTADLYPHLLDAAHRITVTRYISQQIGMWSLDWQKLNPDDMLGSLTEIIARWNKRAGVRGMVKKYGRESAQRIIENKSGRTIK